MNYNEQYLEVAEKENNEIIHTLMALNARDIVDVILSDNLPDAERLEQVRLITEHHADFLARLKQDNLKTRQAVYDQSTLLRGTKTGNDQANEVIEQYDLSVSSGDKFERSRNKILRQLHANVQFAADQAGRPEVVEEYALVMGTRPSQSTLSKLHKEFADQNTTDPEQALADATRVEVYESSPHFNLGLAKRVKLIGKRAVDAVAVITGSFRIHPEFQHASSQHDFENSVVSKTPR